jgi:hypothetical protein
MPSKDTSGLRGTTLGLTRRGRKVPRSLVRRLVEGRRRKVENAMKKTNAIRRLAERDMRSVSEFGKRVVSGAQQDGKTMAALRQAARRVSSYKLKAPVVAAEIGGLLAYTLNFTPPYDYVMSDGDIDGRGNVRTANPRSGTLDWNIEDERNDGFLYFGWVEMGSFFFPPVDQRIVSVRSNPSYNWSWWIASAGPAAEVSCEILVGLAGFRGVQDPSLEVGGVDVFQPAVRGAGFQFDMGSATKVPLQRATANLPADLYLAFVQIWGTVGVGHPNPGGAVSGATLRATVPSITVVVEREPVVLST